jgi:rare lipoprotein A
MAAAIPGSQSGIASWYSEQDAGIRPYTASGESFDDSKLTCASWHYEFGTYIKVTNPKTGRSVVCRVNDRGPAKRLRYRIIDLSKASFKAIAPLRQGLVRVRITVLNRR